MKCYVDGCDYHGRVMYAGKLICYNCFMRVYRESQRRQLEFLENNNQIKEINHNAD